MEAHTDAELETWAENELEITDDDEQDGEVAVAKGILRLLEENRRLRSPNPS